MTEYEERITSSLADMGFNINPMKMLDSAYRVGSKHDNYIGILEVKSDSRSIHHQFCTIQNVSCLIVFDEVEENHGRTKGADLTINGNFTGMIKL